MERRSGSGRGSLMKADGAQPVYWRSPISSSRRLCFICFFKGDEGKCKKSDQMRVESVQMVRYSIGLNGNFQILLLVL